MGLTTALFTGLSGLTTNSQAIAVTGDNIANLNTTGYKASRVTFETQISDILISPASGPSATLGGTNVAQIGLGTSIGSVTRNFNDGALAPTGVATDLAIEGNGFFVLEVNGVQRFTRAGSFQLDSDFNLVNPDGGLVQGYGVDSAFNVVSGALMDLKIPIGVLTLSEATSTVTIGGNLNTDGPIAQNGSFIQADAIFSNPGATIPATATDALATLFDASGSPLFALGDVITFNGATKGGATLPAKTFEVGPNNTTGSDDHGDLLQGFIDFLEDVMGIDTSVSGGIAVNAGGQIEITGNSGTVNDIDLDNGNIIVNQTTTPVAPFVFTDQQVADGESVRTTFVAFDSLGSPLQIDMSFVLESKQNTGTTWRYYAQSDDDTDLNRVVGTGLIDFDTNGTFVTVDVPAFTVDRNNTGAFSPQSIAMEFDSPLGALSGLADSLSQVQALSQDGSPIGTLQDFTVSGDGRVVGVFSNSLLRDLGQIVLAKFANPVGLSEEGASLFNVSANSGIAGIVAPGTGGAGRIVGGALELSNADLSNEFISLINYSTGFTASSRILTTSDRLMQELLAAIR